MLIVVHLEIHKNPKLTFGFAIKTIDNKMSILYSVVLPGTQYDYKFAIME